jgi:hypothetical protein
MLTFGKQAVGTTSPALTAQFQNIGLAALTISGIAATGDFSQTNSCPSSLPVQSICTVTVTFTPTTAGTRTGTITITDNAPGGTQSIVLVGTGTGSSGGPAVTLSSASLNFASTTLGTSSDPQTLTITNSGGGPLQVGSVTSTGDFSQSNNCTSVAPGDSCAIKVRFTPSAAGQRSGSLSISHNAPGGPIAVVLTGVGSGNAPVTGPIGAASPQSLTFGAQAVGSPASLNITLANSGSADLSVTGISIEGDFTQTNNCGSTVTAGSNCAITVTFTPTALGTRTGRVIISDNAPNGPQIVTLSGTGGIGQITLTPNPLSFSAVTVGTSSVTQDITVTNAGQLPVAISSVRVAGDFSVSETCSGTSLAAQGACTITVTFTPTATGSRTGLVTVVDDAPGNPHTVVLAGTGS